MGGVVQVHGLQLVQADGTVELFQHAIEVAYDVVAFGPHAGAIEAHAHVLWVLHLGNDRGQLLEARTHLGALAGHGVQQHASLHGWRDDLVQGVGHVGQPLFHADVQTAARADEVQRAVHLSQARQIL